MRTSSIFATPVVVNSHARRLSLVKRVKLARYTDSSQTIESRDRFQRKHPDLSALAPTSSNTPAARSADCTHFPPRETLEKFAHPRTPSLHMPRPLPGASLRLSLSHTQPSRKKAAHMEIAEPTIEEAFDRCVAAGAQKVVLHPFFLSPGRHVTSDIPALMNAAAKRHPEVAWVVSEPLGLQELMPRVMHAAVSQSVEGGGWRHGDAASEDGNE